MATAALEIVRGQSAVHQWYLHEFGTIGINEQVRWATRGGGKMYRIMTRESSWITDILQVAEELREFDIHGMVGLLQPEVSRAVDMRPQVEERGILG